MIETRRLKNVVIFVQTILSFVLPRKIFKKYFFKLNFFIYQNNTTQYNMATLN